MQDGIDLEWTHLREVLERYGETARELYRQNLTESGRPTTQNSLINSLRTEVVVGETSIAVDLSLLDYYKYIEHGTRPHWAPIAPLKEWVRVKPLLPRPISGRKLPTPEQLENAAAYAVRWKIHEEGTVGKNDLGRALEETWARMAQDISDAITLDIEAELDYVLSYLLVP